MKYTKTREILIEIETIRLTNERQTRKKSAKQTKSDAAPESGGETELFEKINHRLQHLFDDLLRRV
jgi:hypothetical protein